MDIKRRVLNYYKRWNIEFDSEQVFIIFRNRLVVIIKKYFPCMLTNIDNKFAYLYGCSVTAVYSSSLDKDLSFSYLYKVIIKAETIRELSRALECFFIALEEIGSPNVLELADDIREATELSPGVGLRVVKNKGSVTFYPAGAKLLDQGVVNDVLNWLQDYPKVAKHFEQALKIYLDGDRGKDRNLLDNLRFALEQLLKEVLNNKKSLENQQKYLLSWLNSKGLHQEVVNLYNQFLFGQYCMYHNNAVKHSEEFSKKEIEFMIYQTGNFIRLVLQLV